MTHNTEVIYQLVGHGGKLAAKKAPKKEPKVGDIWVCQEGGGVGF
ncbi:hypothetical protein AO373_1050 [Moraxella catarrhalis]|nr:hypothetical protein [Moraxella catarrhalis]OAV18466.1 hypothetical protein AO373_1050 [Moraxella catarrhalis]